MRATRRGLLALVCWLATCAAAQAVVNPPVLKWQQGGCAGGYCSTGWYSSPAVADLDDDGQNEVVYGMYEVVVLNGATGAERARGVNGSRVWPGISIADLTGDGTKEIVVGRGGNQLHAYRFNPMSSALTVAWSRNPFANNCGGGTSCEVRTLAVEDLESDGQLEVIVGRASGGSSEQLNVYDGNGSQRPGWPARRASEAGYGWGMYNENVAIADMNGDGFKEIFGPTDTHYITALDRDGNQLAANAVYGSKVWSEVGVHVDHLVDVRGYANCGVEHRPNFADSAPSIADVDNDGVPELIVVGNVYNCDTSPYTDLYHMPFILRLDRTRWSGNGYDWTAIPTPDPGSAPRSEDFNVIENALPNPVVADLDNDGFKEIVYPSYDGKVHAYWLDKTEHGSWPYTVPASGGADDFRFAGEPVVADLDGDGQAEVIFTSWPKKAVGGVGHLHVLSSLGVQLFRVNLPAPSIGETLNGGLAAPTLANIDGDADLEIVVGTISSGAVAYDLPGSAGARVLWATGRGSNQRTGVAAAAFVSLTPVTTTVGEGAGAVTVSARVTTSDGSPVGAAATVDYATADGSALAGSDYTARTGTLDIPAGTASGAVLTVATVPILDDAVSEGNQSFSIAISAFTNIVSGPATTQTITITDNEVGPDTSEVYRLRHPAIGAYLFTIYSTERDAAGAQFGYLYEGICCDWFNTPAGDGRTELFRLYSATAGEYFFTIYPSERDDAVARFGYVYEGVAAYCHPTSTPASPRPWFRLRYGNKHFYTVYPEERDAAVSQYGYVYEGVSCYLPPP
jgi:Calx-beta domain-containing protein/VCBS repeat protein/uncharacterized protein DUF5648